MVNGPVIGITTGTDGDETPNPQQRLPLAYVRAVERAGGIPIIVPMVERKEAMASVLNRIDGLIITGGDGIVERLVGELPEDLPRESEERTRTDQWAYEGAVRKSAPVLGICYGMQFINAMHGGSICGDVQSQYGTSPHSPKRNVGNDVEHPVSVSAGTILHALVGEEGDRQNVNSYHLQAVEEVGAELRVNAISVDGVIEGIESSDGRILGVQFHPERMKGTVWRRIFDHLIKVSAIS